MGKLVNPRTVEKLGSDLLEALSHIKQARNLIAGATSHAAGQESDLKLAKYGEQVIGQLDRLYDRITKYKTEIVGKQDIKESSMKVSREFKEAARKEIRRQKRLRESFGSRDVINQINKVIRALDVASQDLLDAERMLQQGKADPKINQAGQAGKKGLSAVQGKLASLSTDLARVRETFR